MLATIRQPEPASILIPFVESMVKQDFGNLLEKAGKYGVLKELVNYWNKHPTLHEFYLQETTVAIASAAESSLPNEINAFSMHVLEEEKIRGAVVVQQHLQVRKRTVKPMLPHEILLKISYYIKNGADFINWVKALEEEQYPSRGDLPLILELQEKTGLKSIKIWPT